jgi:hypothetical protein
MIRILLLLSIFLFTINLCAQVLPMGGPPPPSPSGTIYFQYDTSGNQKSRTWCLNCANKNILTKVQDSVQLEILDEPIDELQTNIIAYPNPVSDYLQLKWVENPSKQPSDLYLFSMDSKMILQKKITKKYGNTEISLQKYPSGVYILLVVYTNGEKESFNIIKI